MRNRFIRGIGRTTLALSIISLGLAFAAVKAYCSPTHTTKGVTGTTLKGHMQQQAKEQAYQKRKAEAAKRGLERQKTLRK